MRHFALAAVFLAGLGLDLGCNGDGRVPAAVMKDLIGPRCTP